MGYYDFTKYTIFKSYFVCVWEWKQNLSFAKTIIPIPINKNNFFNLPAFRGLE